MIVVGALSLVLFAGAGPWMAERLAPALNDFLRSVATVFGFSAVIHLALVLPVFLLHKFFARLLKRDIVYQ
jgi:hypothetical protein